MATNLKENHDSCLSSFETWGGGKTRNYVNAAGSLIHITNSVRLFFLFPKSKGYLKGERFANTKDRNEIRRCSFTLSQDKFQRCFNQWKTHWNVKETILKKINISFFSFSHFCLGIHSFSLHTF